MCVPHPPAGHLGYEVTQFDLSDADDFRTAVEDYRGSPPHAE
jgi:hypothetical protein